MGGAETSLLELLACVRRAEPDWELILILGEAGPLAHSAERLGVRVIVESFPTSLAQAGDMGIQGTRAWFSALRAVGAAAFYSRRLARIMRAVQPDIIHTNGFKMHLLGALVRPPGTPVIWHMHDYVSLRQLMSQLLYLQRRRCSVAIANSESVAADVRASLPGLKVVPIYNAVDEKKFSPDGERLDLDELSGLPSSLAGTVRVGLVGTFARWKGHKEFLQALSLLPPEVNVRGYIIGGPIYQTRGSQCTSEELRQHIKQLGLTGRVGLTGFVENCPAAMRSLDVIVHASTAPEPFGMVIIEGMACGKAVIASLGGGAAELVSEGENALTHRPGDIQGLSQQILRLATDSGLRLRLGNAGRAAVEKLYYGRRLAEQMTAVYRDICSGSSVGGDDICAQPGSIVRQESNVV